MGCSQSSKAKAPAKPEVVTADDKKPAAEQKAASGEATEEKLKAGDRVSVSKDGGFEGEVVRCTTTDVLVKGPDGQENWCDVEDIQSKSNSKATLPLQTEVKVGEVVRTSGGVSGTVTKRTTTEVCLKTEAGEEVCVDIEDITYLSVCIQGAVGLRNADFISKSDPYCTCQLEGKPDSKVQTTTVSDNLDPLWNFETRMVSYMPGDVLIFEIYDKDSDVKFDDFLGRARLTGEAIGTYGFFGDLTLEDASGNAAKGTLRVQVRFMNGEISQPEADPQVKIEELSSPAGQKRSCCC